MLKTSWATSISPILSAGLPAITSLACNSSLKKFFLAATAALKGVETFNTHQGHEGTWNSLVIPKENCLETKGLY